MDEQELKELLALGREQSGIEFKRSGPRTNKQLLAKVIRAVLSMANRQDGGLVIIGVEDVDNRLIPTGMSDDDLTTWSVYDDLADAIAPYVDPYVRFELEIVSCDGKKFGVIHVMEFDDIPVLCKRNYEMVLREGACYVRTKRKPETTEISTQTEMRDLLDLAITKKIRKYISIAHTAGLELSEATKQNDEQLYKRQLGDLVED